MSNVSLTKTLDELELQNKCLSEQVEKLKLELQEASEAADLLLAEKLQAAASIIKSQTMEYSQLLQEKEELERKFNSNVSEFDGTILMPLIEIIPESEISGWGQNHRNIINNLVQKYLMLHNQVQEQIHYLKITSDGFNYEREVLEKENQDLSIKNSSLLEENRKLSDTLSQVKNAVGEKLKMELAEKENMSLEIQDLKLKESKLLNKISKLESSLMEKEQNSQNAEEIQSYINLNEKLTREIERLRGHLLEVETNHHQDILSLETTISSLKVEISEANREQKSWEETVQAEKSSKKEMQDLLNELHDEISRLNKENEKLKSKANEDLQVINNLQTVLNDFQAGNFDNLNLDRDSEIKVSLALTQEKLDLAISENQKLETRALEAESKILRIESEINSSNQLSSMVSTKDTEIKKLKHDIANLQSHLSEAMRRLKTGLNSDIVDKKLISNLFVQFLSLPRGDSKKYEILDVISGILDLSTSDKVKVGLIHDKVESPKESSFTDMWISFLYKEAGMLDEGH